MNHKEYIDILSEKKRITHKIKRIQNKSHQVGTYNIRNIFLSCFDGRNMYLMMELKL